MEIDKKIIIKLIQALEDLKKSIKGIEINNEDNSVDVLTNDIAIFLIFKDNKLLGYNIAIGGGLGMTHNKPETFPYLAKPLLFCNPTDLIQVLEQIVKIQRDYGDRKNRKHARLKYLVAEEGTKWFKRF